MSKNNPDGRGKRPRDPIQFAKWIVEATTEPEAHPVTHKTKSEIAGKLGGLKGGIARAMKLGPKKRSQIAKRAANKRWAKREKP